MTHSEDVDDLAPVGPSDLDLVLRLLADPHRRQILRLVRSAELAAGQIAMHFEMTQQAVSQHLRLLLRAGLVRERRDGTRRLYTLRPDPIAIARSTIDELWPDTLRQRTQVVEHDTTRHSGSETETPLESDLTP